jgi:dihydroneopterin aldolase
MSDAIFITGLALHAYHGVMAHESKVGQTFKLDLHLDIDLAEASRSDKIKHTVSYDQVVQTATEAFSTHRYQLVEAAAGAVADAVLKRFPEVRGIRVTIHKPHAPIAATFDDVGVVVERARQRAEDQRGQDRKHG